MFEVCFEVNIYRIVKIKTEIINHIVEIRNNLARKEIEIVAGI